MARLGKRGAEPSSIPVVLRRSRRVKPPSPYRQKAADRFYLPGLVS